MMILRLKFAKLRQDFQALVYMQGMPDLRNHLKDFQHFLFDQFPLFSFFLLADELKFTFIPQRLKTIPFV